VTDPSRRLFTLANFISFGRLLLLIPLFVFLRDGKDSGGNNWALVVMGVALLTDMLDGLIARAFGQVSDWGKLLDPLADKVWIGCLALFLALPWREHPLPWEFLALLLTRDLAIVFTAIFAYRRIGVITPSNWIGKVTMFCEALTLIAFTIYLQPVSIPWLSPEFLMWLTTVMIMVSGVSYTIRLRSMLAQAARAPVPGNSSSIKMSS
jgi:CDP-diacylglycerol---glycerol-3-phosphate 3-phosphatidyltransferase